LHREAGKREVVAVKAPRLLVWLLLVAVPASGQSLGPAADERPAAPAAGSPADPLQSAVFRTGVDLVALTVVVTDVRQRFIGGLTEHDFAVFEDGVQQDISFFAAAAVPLDLALLLDTSASMADKMDTMQQAAIGFLRTLRTGDRAAIVDIKDNVQITYGLGGDVPMANDAVRKTVARGGTALFNGLYLTLKEMVKQRKANGDVRRQAIAVLSDGEDTASLVGFDDVMELAKQSGISIYTITLRSPSAVKQAAAAGRRYFSQAEFAMKSLAQETGARAFFPSEIRELGGVYGVIADELANQYAIGYSPKNARRDGAFRRVVVRIAERPDARTRTRSGYVAARQASNTSSH
jgi:Ca-activated chloride channel family protein